MLRVAAAAGSPRIALSVTLAGTEEEPGVPPIELDHIDTQVKFTSKSSLPSEAKHLFRTPPLLHEEYELFFVARGDITFLIEESAHLIEPGSLLVFNNQEVHKLHVRSDERFDRMRLLFDAGFARQFGSEGYDPLECFAARPKGEGNVIRLSREQRAEAISLFERMGQAAAGSGPEARLQKLAAFLEILVFANRAYRSQPEPGGGEELPERLAAVLRYIEGNLGGDLSLEAIGAACGTSVFHMSRLFKKYTGGTLHEHILYKRLSLAKRLLAEGWPPAEVGAICGFTSGAGFAAAFRRVVGTTPGAFAKSAGPPPRA
ncbi:MAG TPA: AraC family transcriptional regulator [Spirochaetales bacterium]|nr:AraC family transcriptional regulator [Spirochaetales bacterium]HRZ64897.1 AraC family transcriptional regulator [Spirochaetia bacterium]